MIHFHQQIMTSFGVYYSYFISVTNTVPSLDGCSVNISWVKKNLYCPQGLRKREKVLWFSWVKKSSLIFICRKRGNCSRNDLHSWHSGYFTVDWKLIHGHEGEVHRTHVRWGCKISCFFTFVFLSPALWYTNWSRSLSLPPLPPQPHPSFLITGFHKPPDLHHFGFPQLFLGRDTKASVSQRRPCIFLPWLMGNTCPWIPSCTLMIGFITAVV